MKVRNKHYWFLVGLGSALLGAPNATVIKYTLGDIDPYLFNSMRFLLIAVITTPYLIKRLSEINKQNLKHALLAGVYMAIAVQTYVGAIKLSQASYVSVITLLTPIILIYLSAKLTGEKITSRGVAGISLAVLGAMVIIVLPIAIRQNTAFVFYPLATVFALINCVTFPLSVINYKKSNEAGMSMGSLMSISAWVILVVSFVGLLVTGGSTHIGSSNVVWGILYSAIMVSLVSRIMGIVSYEHVGSIVISALTYLENTMAVLIPVIFLHEKLYTEMIVGAILIIAGVYVTEHHRTAHHKHHHYFKPH